MRAALIVLAGLAFGATLSASACCGGPMEDYPKLQAGRYRGAASTSSGFDTPEPDYQIVLAADGKTVTESFTRGGKAYEVKYTITGSEETVYEPSY